MNRLLPLLAAVLLLACPKRAVTTVAGSDDEQMDALSAKSEEIRTRTDLSCKELCTLQGEVCDLSRATCDLAGRHADSGDFQKRCTSSQEECARFNESCASCPK